MNGYRNIGFWEMRVKSSGDVVRAQVWIRQGKLQVFLDENWYSLDCFERLR